jgi:hypothetical protein
METYKNSYSVKEDEVLWELHEIRHSMHNDLKNRPLNEINRSARDIFESWKCGKDEYHNSSHSLLANKEQS